MRYLLLSMALIFISTSAQAFPVTVTYSWDSRPDSEQVTQYLCERQINGGVFVSCAGPIVPPVNMYTETFEANAGDDILFRVKACNVVGCSPFSVGASAAVPPNIIPGVPLNELILPMVIQ